MQNNHSPLRQPCPPRQEDLPIRRLKLRGDRKYLRALRAAEMAAWETPPSLANLEPAQSPGECTVTQA